MKKGIIASPIEKSDASQWYGSRIVATKAPSALAVYKGFQLYVYSSQKRMYQQMGPINSVTMIGLV